MSDSRPNVLAFRSIHGGTGQTALSAHVALGLARSERDVLFVELQTPSAAAPYLRADASSHAGGSFESGPVPVGLGSLSGSTIQVSERLWHTSLDGRRADRLDELTRLVSSNASRGLWIVIDVPRHIDLREDLGLDPDLEVRVLRADPASLVDADHLADDDPTVKLVLNQIDHRRPVSRAIDQVLGTLLEGRLAARVHYDEAVAEALASCSNVFDNAPTSSAARAFTDLVDLVIAAEPAARPIVASRTD